MGWFDVLLKNIWSRLQTVTTPGDPAPVVVPGTATKPTLRALPGTEFHDRRKTAAQAHGPGGKWKVGRRSWKKVTGVCLHQTACVLGERPARYDTVGAHICITRAGKVIWLHDFDRVVVHGHGWNAQTIGIEIDGLYAGVEGDPKTVWDDPSTPGKEKGQGLTQAATDATKQTLRWIDDVVTEKGGDFKALVAHRQSSDTRRNDPGSAIWKAIALPMSTELGLNDGGAGFKLNDGYPIPEAWDPRRIGIKY